MDFCGAIQFLIFFNWREISTKIFISLFINIIYCLLWKCFINFRLRNVLEKQDIVHTERIDGFEFWKRGIGVKIEKSHIVIYLFGLVWFLCLMAYQPL